MTKTHHASRSNNGRKAVGGKQCSNSKLWGFEQHHTTSYPSWHQLVSWRCAGSAFESLSQRLRKINRSRDQRRVCAWHMAVGIATRSPRQRREWMPAKRGPRRSPRNVAASPGPISRKPKLQTPQKARRCWRLLIETDAVPSAGSFWRLVTAGKLLPLDSWENKTGETSGKQLHLNFHQTPSEEQQQTDTINMKKRGHPASKRGPVSPIKFRKDRPLAS